MIAVMSDAQLLTVTEVAERLRLSIFTVRELLKEGRLHGFRLGGTKSGWRVTEDDLRAFIEAARNEFLEGTAGPEGRTS